MEASTSCSGAKICRCPARRRAPVTALTSALKAGALRDLGACETLEREADIPKRAFDVVLDLLGGPRWSERIDALGDGGRYVCAGAIAGPIVELDLRPLYLRDPIFFGCTYQRDNIFTDLVRHIEAGELRPILAGTHSLRELRAAQARFMSNSHVGKEGILLGS